MNRAFIHPALAPDVPGTVQVALVRVMEECAELSKEAGKALRFSPLNRYPANDITNYAKMRAELADVLEAMADAGAIEHTLALSIFTREIRNL